MVFSLQEVDDNYTKTPSIHPSHGRKCERQFSLLPTFQHGKKCGLLWHLLNRGFQSLNQLLFLGAIFVCVGKIALTLITNEINHCRELSLALAPKKASRSEVSMFTSKSTTWWTLNHHKSPCGCHLNTPRPLAIHSGVSFPNMRASLRVFSG